MTNNKVLTEEQQDWVCYQIGEWYLEWKNDILVPHYPGQHNFGYAKEALKKRLCEIKKPQELKQLVNASTTKEISDIIRAAIKGAS